MKIRKAKAEDVDIIWQLGLGATEFQVSDEVVVFWPKKILVDCVRKGSVFVAEHKGEIVGFVISNYNPSFKKAIIENIFVRQDFRRAGVGKSLLNRLLRGLKTVGCEYICALVEKTDRSGIDFYIGNGFSKGVDCVWLDLILKSDFKKVESI